MESKRRLRKVAALLLFPFFPCNFFFLLTSMVVQHPNESTARLPERKRLRLSFLYLHEETSKRDRLGKGVTPEQPSQQEARAPSHTPTAALSTQRPRGSAPPAGNSIWDDTSSTFSMLKEGTLSEK